MKGRVILLQMVGDRLAAALTVDGRVQDLMIDPPPDQDRLPHPGAIYRGKVLSQSGKLGVFVDIGGGETAFLRGQSRHRPGSFVTVQITGYAETGKAAPAIDRMLHKGQLLILTPDAPGVNVSRQIRGDEEHARLTEAVSEAQDFLRRQEAATGDSGLAEQLDRSGIIIRSAARGADTGAITHELRRLTEQQRAVEAAARGLDGVGCIWQSAPALETAVTEWWQPQPDAIQLCERTSTTLQEAFAARIADPNGKDLIETGLADPFDHFGIWDEIQGLRSHRVDLPSGSWMSVEPTRALTAVDINTGAQFNPAAALTANIEAARELPRQLRLRGLGGQITVDFAPLKKAERKRIEETLKAAFRKDPIETSLAGWTPLGHFELQRKRERRPLTECLAAV